MMPGGGSRPQGRQSPATDDGAFDLDKVLIEIIEAVW